MTLEVNKLGAVPLNQNANSAKDAKGKEVEKMFDIKIANSKKGLAVEKNTTQKQEGLGREARKLLVFYGIDVEAADWVGVDKVQVKDVNGVKQLVLTSNAEKYELTLPINKDYDPSKIKMWRSEDFANVHFEGINGEFKNTSTPDEPRGGYAFHNSNVKITGADGVSDLFAIYSDTKATVVTGDYADTVEGRINSTGKANRLNLKPGTHHIAFKPKSEVE